MQEKVITTSFASLGLSAELLRAVGEQGYTETTPIQKQAIPLVLAGRDLLGAAQTGTGKTAGFALPILQRLSGTATASHSPARHPVRALIITPTRELAIQVEESFRTYGKYSALRSTLVYGGVGIQPQIMELRRGVDILVATPGRLLDHVQQKTVDLRQVEILVLDEGDRMLDMGFIHDIRKILALLPAKRQNLLFSATFPEEIRKLAASFMKDPATVEVARRNTPAELVAQVAHPVDHARKRELLAHLVKSNDWKQVLVFCKTKHGANRLAQQLSREGVHADAIHGNKTQGARVRALEQFKAGKVRVLVSHRQDRPRRHRRRSGLSLQPRGAAAADGDRKADEPVGGAARCCGLRARAPQLAPGAAAATAAPSATSLREKTFPAAAKAASPAPLLAARPPARADRCRAGSPA